MDFDSSFAAGLDEPDETALVEFELWAALIEKSVDVPEPSATVDYVSAKAAAWSLSDEKTHAAERSLAAPI